MIFLKKKEPIYESKLNDHAAFVDQQWKNALYILNKAINLENGPFERTKNLIDRYTIEGNDISRIFIEIDRLRNQELDLSHQVDVEMYDAIQKWKLYSNYWFPILESEYLALV